MPRVTLGDRRVLVPEAILPDQFAGLWRRRIPTPEVELLLAMLEQAAGDLRPFRPGVSNRRARRLYRDAYEWVTSLDRSHPFSFTNVCEAVGVSPDAMRERFLRQQPGEALADVVRPQPATKFGTPAVIGSQVATAAHRVRLTTLPAPPTPV